MQALKYLKKIARTIAVLFPFSKDIAYNLKRLLRQALASPYEADFNVIDLLPDSNGALFLDIGANQGAATDVLLRKNKTCKIYSFEPNPGAYRKMLSRFRSNDRVKVFNFGLGEKAGAFRLYIPFYRGYEFDGWASLSPDLDDSWLSDGIYFYNKRLLQMQSVDCEIRRLDDLHLEPYFIKVDAQGFELEVLRGGEATIKATHPIILLESGDDMDAIVDFLSPLGYRLYRYSAGTFIEGEAGSPNSFFITDEKFRLLAPSSHTNQPLRSR